METPRIWLCDCGRVHLETRNCRMSFMPTEFLAWLRSSAGVGGARINPPQQSYLNEACEPGNLGSRAVQRQPLLLAA